MSEQMDLIEVVRLQYGSQVGRKAVDVIAEPGD